MPTLKAGKPLINGTEEMDPPAFPFLGEELAWELKKRAWR